MNVFRDTAIRNATMLLCGMIPGLLVYFDFMDRNPYSASLALVGLIVGFLSVSVRQCVENAILSVLGFILSFIFLFAAKSFWAVTHGAALDAFSERALAVLSAGLDTGPTLHLTWLMAVPMGYGLRRMIKGERKKKKSS